MTEPGTIYSDDEIENYSDDNDEDEKEIAKNRISMKKTNEFFNDLFFSKQKFLDEISTEDKKANLGGISKYMDNKKLYDLDLTIEKVKSQQNINVQIPINNVTNTEDTVEKKENLSVAGDKLKMKEKDVKKKEKKKLRKTQENEEKLRKEKEELSFEDAPPAKPNTTFLEMNLSTPILKAITQIGYQIPTLIQAATIPIALKGRDICGCAATGTGKTAAFMLPIIQRLIFRPTKDAITRVLVLVPTRELGVQVYEVTKELAQMTNLNVSLTVGGLNMNTQTEELLQNPDIIIATPGRLIDHIHNTPSFSLREIEILVLDEADRMLDEFFAEQLKEIVRQCCVTRQTMLFSATMTDEVKDLVAVSLKNPVRIFVNNNTDVAQNLRQEFVRIRKIKTEDYRLAVLAYLLTHNFKEKTIVFVKRKSQCHTLHITLGLLGIKCGELHGDLKQNERLNSLYKFKKKQINVLLATDVAARGLDIKGVQTVINYTVPDTYQTYVHRVGRTARAGFSGRSVTIAFESGDDYSMLRTIQKNALTPLYERIVGSSNVEPFYNQIEKIKSAVEEVLEIEKAEKTVSEADKKIDNLKKKLKNPQTKEETNKPVKRKWFHSENEIKAEKARLKLIIAGKLSGKAIKKYGKKNNKEANSEQIIDDSKVKSKKWKHKKKVNSVNDNNVSTNNMNDLYIPHDDSTNKMKGNFVRELTSTDPETIKRLKKGPTYDERKEEEKKKSKAAKRKGKIKL